MSMISKQNEAALQRIQTRKLPEKEPEEETLLCHILFGLHSNKHQQVYRMCIVYFWLKISRKSAELGFKKPPPDLSGSSLQSLQSFCRCFPQHPGREPRPV